MPSLRVRRAALAVFAAACLPAAHAHAQPEPAAGAPAAPDVRDLPLVEVPAAPATGGALTPAQRTLALVVTGDGDWAALVKGISGTIAGSGTAVVGLKARAYLVTGKRTPDGTARDVERIARHYMARWNRDRLAILGYSRGADFAPFVAARLPADLRAKLVVVGMYGLADAASFEFHWADLVSDPKRPTDVPTAPELQRLRGVPMYCVYGSDEKNSGCRGADSTLVRQYARGGAHHFDGDYAALGGLAVEAIARAH